MLSQIVKIPQEALFHTRVLLQLDSEQLEDTIQVWFFTGIRHRAQYLAHGTYAVIKLQWIFTPSENSFAQVRSQLG